MTLNEALKESQEGNVFSKIIFYDTLSSMVLALNNGDIAMIEIDRNTADYIASRNEEFVVREPSVPAKSIVFSMLLREEDSELCNQISAAVREMDADGTLEILQRIYIEDVIAGMEPEAVEPQNIGGVKTLKVGVTGDRPPMDYISADNWPMGFNTALITGVASRMGMNVEFVNLNTASRGIALQTGRADVIFWVEEDYDNGEVTMGEDVPEGAIATDYYLENPVAFVVLRSSPLAEVLAPAE